MKKKYRVFIKNIGWSDVMFIFDENINFSDMKNNPQTHMLSRENYLGTYEFDKKFISFFNKNKIKDKYYFYRFSYHKDNVTDEEKSWKNIPEFQQKEQKEYKNIKTNNDESNASKSLFD